MSPQHCSEHPLVEILRALGSPNSGGPNSTLSLMNKAHELLRDRFGNIHPADLDRAMYVLAHSAENAFDSRKRASNESSVIDQIQELEQLSNRLAKLISNLDWHVGHWELPPIWRESFPKVRTRTNSPKMQTAANQSPMSIEQLKWQLTALGKAAGVLHAERKAERQANRPSDGTLSDLAYSAILAWSSLSLLAGATVANALPTSRNSGSAWCTNFIQAAIDASNKTHGTELAWSDTTIGNELGIAKKELVSFLLNNEHCEPEHIWPILGLDSIIGMMWLTDAMHVDSIGEMLVPLKSAPLYFVLYPREANAPVFF